MIVRCWNCGNDHEVVEASIREAERLRITEMIQKEATLRAMCGDPYTANTLQGLIQDINHSA